ncbi:hypothetical protein ERJ75_001266400 [Trypanosoma vivax]|nr:hypothetical protein ERJ75_001266400 [Trypanosoma vivax]
MRASFFLAVALAAQGTLVRDGSAAAGDTVMEFRALCRLATALDAFKHLNASRIWEGDDPVTQISATLQTLEGRTDKPCERRAKTFIGGQRHRIPTRKEGVTESMCDEDVTDKGNPQHKGHRTVLCDANTYKNRAEEQIAEAQRLAMNALWGQDNETVTVDTLQLVTWADTPRDSGAVAGIDSAGQHCVASNVLWLCMDGTDNAGRNPCFKQARPETTNELESTKHATCHTGPDQALKVWKGLAPLCINASDVEKRTANELAREALDAAEGVIAKIRAVGAGEDKFILGPEGTTAETCNKGAKEICIKFGSDNNKLNEIYWHEQVRRIANAVAHADTLAAEARTLATHARLTAAQCLATEEEASTTDSTETNENRKTATGQEAKGSESEAHRGGRERRHTDRDKDEARTSEKTKAQRATSQHSAATAHRQQHAEAALAILAARLARSARHK